MSHESGYPVPVPPMVSSFTRNIGVASVVVTPSLPNSATYEYAAQAHFYPVLIPSPCVVRRVWWANGATVSGGATIEVGIYADSGYMPSTKIISGSAVQGTALTVQFVDVADTTLAVARYWVAIVSDSATNTTILRSLSFDRMKEMVRFEQQSATPLPATATPVEASYRAVYVCGFATTASP